MYAYIFDTVFNGLDKIHFILGPVCLIASPFAMVFLAFLLFAYACFDDKDFSVPTSVIILPALATIEGVAYGIASANFEMGYMGWIVPVRNALSVAELAAATYELYVLVRAGCRRPICMLLASACIGYVPFLVLSVLGALIFGLQMLVVIFLVLIALFFLV